MTVNQFSKNCETIVLFIWAACLVFVPPGFSQSFRTEKYDIEDGLPSNYVSSIVQDSLGRMWFATRGGIAVYDGKNWEKNNPEYRYNSIFISKLAIGPNGSVWAAPQQFNHSVQFYRNGAWHKIPPLKNADAFKMRIHSFAILKKDQRLYLAVGTFHHGLFIWDGREWHQLTEKSGLPSSEIRGIVTLNNLFYVATTAGLAIIDGKCVISLPNELVSQIPREILGITVEKPATKGVSPENKIWLAGKNWIGQLSRNHFKSVHGRFHLQTDIPYNYIVMQPDGIGGLFLGNPIALCYLNPDHKTLIHFNKSAGLLASGVTALYRDREANTWIGSFRGLTKLTVMRFANYGKAQGLLEDEVTAIQELRPEVLVLGHNNGLTLFNERSGEKRKIRFPWPNLQRRILDISRARKGGFWVAAFEAGLARLYRDGTLKWIQRPEFKHNVINSAFEESDGTLWVAGHKAIYKLKNGNIKTVNLREFTPIRSVRRIIGLRDHTLAFLTVSVGFYLLHEGKWQHWSHPSRKAANSIYSVYQLPDGSLLAGTAAGIFIVKNNRWRPFRKKGQGVDKPVYFIFKDSRERFWFGTDDGIYRWDNRNWRHYTTLSGLAGPELNRAAVLEDAGHHLWFGSDRGLSRYQEEFDHQKIPTPLVTIDSVEVNGRKTPLSQLGSLSYQQNDLSLHFHAISFISERNVYVQTRLLGLEKNWTEDKTGTSVHLRYPNLKSGKYRFQIRARNALGNWGPVFSSPFITINTPIWKKIWFYPLLVLAAGIFIVIIFIVITREKYLSRLEREVEMRTAQLAESEKKFRTLFEESRDAIYISSPEGHLLDINGAGVQLFGYNSREEMFRLEIAKDLFVNPEDRERLLHSLKENGSVQDYETVLKKKNGQEIIALETATVEKNENGEIKALRGSIRDVTEQRRLEEKLFQAQKMESIGTLAGGIAHDFNNILGGILGYASFIKMKINENASIYKYVDIIEKGASRAAELTSQLLAFARGGRYDVRPFNLNNSIREILKIIAPTFDKNIVIQTQLAKNLPTIEGDPGQIQQLIMNLCINARDAMPKGGQLTLATNMVLLSAEFARAHPGCRSGQYVQLIVSDTGIGMDSETRQRVFEPFFSTKEKGKGTGLGLAMVYGTVKSHDGYILIESEPGKGSEFQIFLPISGKAELRPEKLSPDIKTGTETIMVVDDEENIRGLLMNLLENSGYRVIPAHDGQQALEIYRKRGKEVHLIILDMIMPRMGGRETYEQLKAINPDVRVLFSSGYFNDFNLQEMTGFAPRHFVQKPYRVNDLLAKVRTVLESTNSFTASEYPSSK